MQSKRTALALAGIVVALCVSMSARQAYVTGVFMQTESGTAIEMICWATLTGVGQLKMDRGFLEDAPVVPRTYRFLVNLGTYNVDSVVAVNANIFDKPIDRLERRALPFSLVRLGVQTFEVGGCPSWRTGTRCCG